MISVIVPMYNSRKTIKNTIESVLCQAYQDFIEIIVINDGSTDGCEKIVEDLININTNKRNRIIKLINQKNYGVSDARNKAIKESRGEYIAFLDSDDEWHPQKIDIQIETMEKFNFKISGTKHKILDKEILKTEKIIDYKQIKPIPYSIIKWPGILFKSPFATPSVIIHNSLKNYLFDEDLRYSEDYNLWKRITYKHKAIKINLSLTYTFKHDYISNFDSLSANLVNMQEGVDSSFKKLLNSTDFKFIDKFFLVLGLYFSKVKYLRRLLMKVFKK